MVAQDAAPPRVVPHAFAELAGETVQALRREAKLADARVGEGDVGTTFSRPRNPVGGVANFARQLADPGASRARPVDRKQDKPRDGKGRVTADDDTLDVFELDLPHA